MRWLSRSSTDFGNAELLDIFGRGIDVVMHGEELALNEIGLHRPAQPDRDVGLAHGEIELAVIEQQGHLDLRIEIGEFGQMRRQPHRAQADGRGDAQFARRLVLRIHEPRLRRGELREDVMGGAVKHLALFGKDEAARMAMKQRNVQILLERADLPAHRRL